MRLHLKKREAIIRAYLDAVPGESAEPAAYSLGPLGKAEGTRETCF